MDDLVASLKVELARANVLSLDVFDTCLLRQVGTPTQVFDIIEHDLTTDPALHDLSGGRAAFHLVRPRAEQEARKRLHGAKRTSEVTLNEVYAEIQRMTSYAPCDIERLQRMELESERKLALANPAVLALAQYAQERGIEVVYISDMYLSRDFICDLLTSCGYSADPLRVFVSSEYRVSKWGDGALFNVVSKALGIPLNRFLHIGDNLDADVKTPRRLGMRSFHTPKFLDRVVARDREGRSDTYLLARPEQSVALGLRDGLLACDLATGNDSWLTENFWFKLGYERVGILYLGFIQWLIGQCQNDNVDMLIFLARDGYIAQRVFQSVCEARGLSIKSAYVYASRRAIVFPSLLGIDQSALDLLAAGRNMSVRAYLERFGLTPDRFVNDALDCSFTSLDQVVKEPQEYANLGRLFTLIAPELLRTGAREASHVQQYFDQLDLPQTGRLGVMDIGWHGSMQEGLTTLLRLSGRSCPVNGYYLGLHQGAQRRLEKGHVMKGFLSNVGQPEDINSWILSCVELVEFLFLAPHGSCLGFTEADGRIVPVLEDDPSEEDNRRKATMVQEGALRFIEAALPVLRSFPNLELDARGSFYPYAQVIMDPTIEESRTLGDLTHEQNLGQGRWYLANPDAVKNKQADVDTVFWKIGYQRRARGK